MKQTQKEMNEAGIEMLGKLTQAEVGKLYQRASILAYPTECAEIDCISVRKAQAAGCLPVVTDFGPSRKVHSLHGRYTRQRRRTVGGSHASFTSVWKTNTSSRNGLNYVSKRYEPAVVFDDCDAAERKKWSRQFEWNEIAAKWNEILTA